LLSSSGSHGQNDHGLLNSSNPAFGPVFEAFDEPACADCPHLCTRQRAPQHFFGSEPGKNPKKAPSALGSEPFRPFFARHSQIVLAGVIGAFRGFSAQGAA